ncbi:hypothetical protein MRX96_035406 [Rhipicephalus microplus]
MKSATMAVLLLVIIVFSVATGHGHGPPGAGGPPGQGFTFIPPGILKKTSGGVTTEPTTIQAGGAGELKDEDLVYARLQELPVTSVVLKVMEVDPAGACYLDERMVAAKAMNKAKDLK